MIMEYRGSLEGARYAVASLGLTGMLTVLLTFLAPTAWARAAPPGGAAKHTATIAAANNVRAPAAEEARLSLERARLQQERELREKELALKEKEIQQNHSTWWSTPLVIAIAAGFLGYLGTLISSYQNLQLERQKQESNLILEAIKTTGTAADKEMQTAANLVFFADAGLIRSIRKSDLDKLRVKARGAGPSLPGPRGVEFERSVTSELQAKLQSALTEYQEYLAEVGFVSDHANGRVTVRVDERDRNNAFFDNESIILGINLAGDPEYLLSEYTWYALKQTNPQAFASAWNTLSLQFMGFCYGLKFYITCSYLNEPLVGRSFYSLSDERPGGTTRPYLFNLDEFKAFRSVEQDGEPHALGEIWGGALWEVRKELGQETTDRIVLGTWKRLQPNTESLFDPKLYVDTIMDAGKAAGNSEASEIVRKAFVRRNLY